MALLAGPPRRDENKEEVVALVRRRLCLVPQSPYTTSVTQEPSEGTPNCCLRARILDSVLSGSSKRRPYFHTTSGSVVMWMAIQRVRSLYSCAHETTKLAFGEWRCLSQTTH